MGAAMKYWKHILTTLIVVVLVIFIGKSFYEKKSSETGYVDKSTPSSIGSGVSSGKSSNESKAKIMPLPPQGESCPRGYIISKEGCISIDYYNRPVKSWAQ